MASPNRSSKRTNTRPRAARAPGALRILKDDHARVKMLFGRFEKTDSRGEKESLASKICNELTLHADMEELIFYPAVRGALEDPEVVNEADVEHAGAKFLIARIREGGATDDHFDAMVKVLGEAIKHHVKEEEGEMFRQVRRTDLDLEELAEQMQEFKRASPAEEEA